MRLILQNDEEINVDATHDTSKMLKWRKISKVVICNHNMLTKLKNKFCGCPFVYSLW